jgi:uncharacterized repeat protein (TIGR01451 family)
MQKIWLLITSALLVACTLLVTIYYWATIRDKPELTTEFNKPPPWVIRPGQNLTLNITIKNEGKVPAKNVGINFTVSIGLKILQSGTNQYNGNFPEIKAGETKVLTLILTTTTAISPGDYPFALIVYAENAQPLTLSDKITVQLPA